MNTPPSKIELARQRLELLYADTAPQFRCKDLNSYDRGALRIVLNELHRLNIAISGKRKTAGKRKQAKKSLHWKPADRVTGHVMTLKAWEKLAGKKRKP